MNNALYIERISKEPTKDMVREIKNKDGEIEYFYIPKSIIQKELLEIYEGHTKWEMLRETVGNKGMFGTGILHYKHPVSGEWLFVTGTASLPHEKKLKLLFPSLESHCFLNAVKKIGVWFGQALNLNIEDKMPDDSMQLDGISEEERATSLTESIAFCKTVNDLKSYRLVVYGKGTPPEIQELYETKLRELKK